MRSEEGGGRREEGGHAALIAEETRHFMNAAIGESTNQINQYNPRLCWVEVINAGSIDFGLIA